MLNMKYFCKHNGTCFLLKTLKNFKVQSQIRKVFFKYGCKYCALGCEMCELQIIIMHVERILHWSKKSNFEANRCVPPRAPIYFAIYYKRWSYFIMDYHVCYSIIYGNIMSTLCLLCRVF